MQSESNVTALNALLGRSFAGLSPQLQRAARFLVAHPEDAALLSMRDLAKMANLPAVTFLRLAQALGYDSYPALRAVYQKSLRSAGSPERFSLKARGLQERGSRTGDLVRSMLEADAGNISLTFQNNTDASLTEAASLIEGASRVVFLGQRSCFPAAFYFHYVYRLMRHDVLLMQNIAGTLADELRTLGERDLLVAISIAPYTNEVVHAVDHAVARGIRVLAITDDPLSPIARNAAAKLIVATASPSFFHSILPLIAVVQTMLALLVARGGDTALNAIERSEAQLEEFRTYSTGKTT